MVTQNVADALNRMSHNKVTKENQNPFFVYASHLDRSTIYVCMTGAERFFGFYSFSLTAERKGTTIC